MLPEPEEASWVCEWLVQIDRIQRLKDAITKGYYWSNEVTWRIAYAENIEILEMMRNSQREYLSDNKWILGAIYYAINHGKLTTAKWALECGYLGIHVLLEINWKH